MEQDHNHIPEQNRAPQGPSGPRPGSPNGPIFVKKSGSSGLGVAIAVIGVGIGGIFVLAIVAAVALPMYSTFKQKAKVGTALKVAAGALPALESHHGETGSFSGLQLDQATGSLMIDGNPIGAGLADVQGMSWDVASSEDCVQLRMVWNTGCPSALCDGVYRVCYEDGQYQTEIEVGDGQLGFDKSAR